MAVPRWPQDESPRQAGLGELGPGGGLGLARQVGLKGVLGKVSWEKRLGTKVLAGLGVGAGLGKLDWERCPGRSFLGRKS
jgi:hypothetical protein